jgi:hypothetical protein
MRICQAKLFRKTCQSFPGTRTEGRPFSAGPVIILTPSTGLLPPPKNATIGPGELPAARMVAVGGARQALFRERAD